VRGVPAVHGPIGGQTVDGTTLVFVFEVDGVRFCHVGDLGERLPGEVQREIGQVDVLMLPVGALGHTLELSDAAAVAEDLGARVVLPMHYFLPGYSKPTISLRPIEQWLALAPRHRRVPDGEVQLTQRDLPAAAGPHAEGRFETWVMEPQGIVALR
jgi:L-ascorbate metabolism protein UlaG (beta-lactamase superfamily)